ncbi:MAG: hypothetical protein DRG39_04810 [Deltaproteobacteria bacterium]|nr:MAG: hypothetical protein DRG39_04810 [Deltaproteobacteria bacterium]
MENEKFRRQCFICNGKFQFGPHRYDGKYISKYNIIVCRNCYNANWDGWAPDYEEKLILHLKKEGLPIPERNEKGFLPRE